MSILLESLRQSSDKQDQDIPGVGDSHFDDEMLSDEWLLSKLRMWKIICGVLVLALVVTSIGWFTSFSSSRSFPISPQTQATVDKKTQSSTEIAEPSGINNTQQNAEAEQAFGALKIESTIEQSQAVKQKYVPKKVQQPVANNRNLPSSQSTSSPASRAIKNKTNSATQKSLPTSQGIRANTGSVLDFESLSQQQQAEMPDLEISSYAVSSNNEKSFVVLNGAFYGQGEVIAPNLVLVSIEKESIVVRYFDQLIRKKYGL